MNKKLLESKMKLFGDSNKTLASYLGITPQSLSAKKTGNKSDFKQVEIVKIKEKYNLSAEEVDDIFLKNLKKEEENFKKEIESLEVKRSAIAKKKWNNKN